MEAKAKPERGKLDGKARRKQKGELDGVCGNFAFAKEKTEAKKQNIQVISL